MTYFAIGTALNNMVNIFATYGVDIHVLPDYGGMPMQLMGSVGRRTGTGLKRDGKKQGIWVIDIDNWATISAFTLAALGDLTTASRSMYVSTIDASGHYSPFLCSIEAPYIGQTLNIREGDTGTAAKYVLDDGILQSATKTSNFTVTTSDHYLIGDTSSGSITFALPALSTANAGVVYSFIKSAAANSLILDPNSTEQINGASTKTVTALNTRLDIVKSGSQWVTI